MKTPPPPLPSPTTGRGAGKLRHKDTPSLLTDTEPGPCEAQIHMCLATGYWQQLEARPPPSLLPIPCPQVPQSPPISTLHALELCYSPASVSPSVTWGQAVSLSPILWGGCCPLLPAGPVPPPARTGGAELAAPSLGRQRGPWLFLAWWPSTLPHRNGCVLELLLSLGAHGPDIRSRDALRAA